MEVLNWKNEPVDQNPVSNQHMTFWPLRLTKFWISQIWGGNLMSLAIIADHKVTYSTIPFIEYSFEIWWFINYYLWVFHAFYDEMTPTTWGLQFSWSFCSFSLVAFIKVLQAKTYCMDRLIVNALCSQHDPVFYNFSSFGIWDGNEMKPVVEYNVPELDVSRIASCLVIKY